MNLPRLPYLIQKTRRDIEVMRGINYSDNLQDGDLAFSENLSANRFPYLSTRNAREKLKDYENITALFSWDKLVAVKGKDLLYDGKVVGQVTEGSKQWAVINTKLVIWPDKVYLDLESQTIKPLAAKAEGTGATFTGNKITVKSGWPDLTKLFKKGDAVEITGCKVQAANNKSFVVTAVTKTELSTTDNAFEPATETVKLTFERKIPELDYICSHNNRLWGVSNKDKTIFASALGDPTNFYVFQGLATDSWSATVGTAGEFTGCIALGDSLLCWKETALHKVLGDIPANYAIIDYEMEGLQKGCNKSMQIINDNLFYAGLHGVYIYGGNTPSLISEVFGRRKFGDAVGGTDGESYYLSVKEGDKYHLMIFETAYGLWLREDNTQVRDFARIGKNLYMAASDGFVYNVDNGKDAPDIKWTAQFTPFYEALQGRKTYSKLLIRTELPKGSYLVVEQRQDGGRWKEVKKVVGDKTTTSPLVLAPGRCDKFEVRLTGKGKCVILGMQRIFRVGSDRS